MLWQNISALLFINFRLRTFRSKYSFTLFEHFFPVVFEVVVKIIGKRNDQFNMLTAKIRSESLFIATSTFICLSFVRITAISFTSPSIINPLLAGVTAEN